MRVALVASPFIPVPPQRYGGTELFVASLAEGLSQRGISTVVYANGASTVNAEVRWRYKHSDWPLQNEGAGLTKELDHLSWAMDDAADSCDIVHINNSLGVTYSRFISSCTVCTLHHPFETQLTKLYERHSDVFYAAISRYQASVHPTLDLQVIHHGLDLSNYILNTKKRGYLSFLGRIAPIKGTHIAIEVAQRTGIPLKIAGEVQPIFRDYFDAMIKPHLDGRLVEYVGEVDLEAKNELLGGSIGLLFPIDWDEPFGLVLVEAMACGTPVFAFGRGAVPEIVSPGVSGAICESVQDMAYSVQRMTFNPAEVRAWVEANFSLDSMVDRYISFYRKCLRHGVDSDSRIHVSHEEAAA
jgi:glycosyltransferase involved in cell wall biosynthesis